MMTQQNQEPDSQVYQEMDAFFRPEGYDSVSFSALEDQAKSRWIYI